MLNKQEAFESLGKECLKKEVASQSYRDTYQDYLRAYPFYEQRRRGSEGRKVWLKKRVKVTEQLRNSNRKIRALIGYIQLNGWDKR